MIIHVRQTSPSASEAVTGNHRVMIDRPTEKGGSDAGPMGGELFLAAIGGCFMSTLLAAVRAREADVTGVQTVVDATPTGTPPVFGKITLTVSAQIADPALLSKIVEIAAHGCIMINTLRDKLDITIQTA